MEGFVGLFCGFLLATIVWFTYIPDAVRAERNTAWQKDAVKHGVAEYVLNPADGTARWQWKETNK